MISILYIKWLSSRWGSTFENFQMPRDEKLLFAILLIGLCSFTQNSFAQATFTDNSTPTQLANQIGGPGVSLTNEVLTSGIGPMVGIFSNGTGGASLEIDEGIFLGTTAATEAFTSNDNPALSLTTNTTYSDPDLLAIDPGNIFDVVIFEVDVTLDPGITDLAIDFQFASDEYPEYVCSPFNDGFGFFVTGPGISGTQNLALVPGSGNPVSVNNINGGSPGAYANGTPCDLGQSADFIVNGNGTAGPVHSEFNGITKLLTGELTGLQAGATYHFKMAIADAGDPTYDSGVFISIIYSPTAYIAQNCDAGTTAPALSSTAESNSCPATTASLSGITASNTPSGTINLQWHSAADPTDNTTLINNVSALPAGTYHAAFYDTTNDCYSPSSPATVTINSCPPPNNAPVIANNNSDATSTSTYAENNTASVDDYDASDPDGETENGGGLTWSISGGADQSELSIDQNGNLTFNTTPDFENPTDVGGNNTYEIEITVTDAAGDTDVQTLTITVTDEVEETCYDVSNLELGVCYQVPSTCGPAPSNGSFYPLNGDRWFDGGNYTDNGSVNNGNGGTFPTPTVGYAPLSGSPSVINDDNGSGSNNLMLESGEAVYHEFEGVPGASYDGVSIIRIVSGGGTTTASIHIEDSNGTVVSGPGSASSSKSGGQAGWDPLTGSFTVPSCGIYKYVISHVSGPATRIGRLDLEVTAGGGSTGGSTIDYTMQSDGTFTSPGEPTYNNQAAMEGAGGTLASCGLGNVADGIYKNNNGTWEDASSNTVSDANTLIALDYALNNSNLTTIACPLPCTDPNLYADNCDFDGDGVNNEDDLDDDNDGVTDIEECTITTGPPPGTELIAPNQPASLDVYTLVASNTPSTGSGSAMMPDGNGVSWSHTGANRPNSSFGSLQDPLYWLDGGALTFTFTQPTNDVGFVFWGLDGDDDISVTVDGVTHNFNTNSDNIDFFLNNGGTTATPPGVTPDGMAIAGNPIYSGFFGYTVFTVNYPTDYTTLVMSIDGGSGFGNVGLAIGPSFALDPDGDGIQSCFDLDSDNDGCSDAYESGATTVATTDYQFPDVDNNNDGLVDAVDADENGNTDYTSTYSDAIDDQVNNCPSNDPPAISNYNSNATATTTYLESGTDPVINYEATDPDGETENGGGLTWSLSGGVDQADFNIDPATGELTFVSPPDFNNPVDDDTDNFYIVTVTVTDVEGLTDIQTLTVEVIPLTEICDNGIDDDGDGDIDCADTDCFLNPSLTDTDGDGIPDCLDLCTEDRDGDGIVDCEDLDPMGWIYYAHTGEILMGSFYTVINTATNNDNDVNYIEDGSSGFYQWTVNVPGTYQMIITPPAGYQLSPSCVAQDPPAYDPTGQPNPNNIGNSQFGNSGFLTSAACTPYYLTFDLDFGDPFVINNNIPIIPLTETVCADGIDNDEDGLIDCADSDCDSSSDCCNSPSLSIGTGN